MGPPRTFCGCSADSASSGVLLGSKASVSVGSDATNVVLLVLGIGSSAGASGPSGAIETLKISAEHKSTSPVRIARQVMNAITLRPASDPVKNVDAMSEMNNGDNPKSDMVVPEAMPRKWG